MGSAAHLVLDGEQVLAGIEIDDVANAVEFLLGDGARNITGTVMTSDAGATA